MAAVTVNPQSLERIKRFLSDPSYNEAIEHSASYNTRLCIERKMRLPFLDAQTGVAQNNCYLWMQKRQRMPGDSPGQLYTYPSKRWRKKRRQYLINFLRPPRVRDIDIHDSDSHSMGAMDSQSSKMGGEDGDDKILEDSKDSWFKDYEEMADPPETGELDDPETDFDDYEETYAKRKKKKTPAKRGTKRSDKFDPATEMEKPYHCEVCGARYKTRPGLSYHVSHSHLSPREPEPVEDENTASSPPKLVPPNIVVPPALVASNTIATLSASAATVGAATAATAAATATTIVVPPMIPSAVAAAISSSSSSSSSSVSSSTAANASTTTAAAAMASAAATSDALAGLKKFQDSFLSFLKHPDSPPYKGEKSTDEVTGTKPPAAPSTYCDFCLGDATENKKTKQAEELVSCSDCGRSGHPSCLQFTANMMISVKKYRWQCIECKCCTLCGTSDNDDQLLFCDDCDRGYHMYCLDPPLSEPPEGSWSCHLCIEEFHKK